jgi:hypothetical protein
VLAERAPEAAMARLDRQYARRRASVSQTPEGTVRLFAEGPGLDAELLATAIDAFRRPDATGEHRSPEQRTWDALIDVASAALRAGDAPANRRVSPHVSVVIREDTLAAARGAAETVHTGPQPFDELCRLLGDATVAAILAREDWLPLEVSGQTRYIPAGLWRALQLRDETCVWPGCDQPARWCDIAHLDVPYRRQGRLTLATSALLCRRHHRRYDRGRHSYRLIDDRPVICHPDGTPLNTTDARAGPDPPATTAPPAQPATPTLFATETRGAYHARPGAAAYPDNPTRDGPAECQDVRSRAVAAFASWSAYSFHLWPTWARIQRISISGRVCTSSYSGRTRSRFSTGPVLRFQPRSAQPAAHSLTVRTTRFESEYTMTGVPGGTSSMPACSAISSIRLFVVCRSPPLASARIRSSSTQTAPQPPGPGFGLAEPSVKTPVVGLSSTDTEVGRCAPLPREPPPLPPRAPLPRAPR